jgi:hypothetical protein
LFTKRLGSWQVAFSAVLGMSFLLMQNGIFILTNIFGISKELHYDKIIIFTIGGGIIIINFFLFDYKSKYKKVIKKYKYESKKSKVIGNVLVTFYVLCTFVSIFYI